MSTPQEEEEVLVPDEVLEAEPEDEKKESEPESQESAEQQPQNEEAEVENLKKQLHEAEETVNELKDRMLRVQADFENFRKRTQREKLGISQNAREDVIEKLLPVLDNLDLAIDHSSTENMEAFKKGVELVQKQLIDTLGSEGLEMIPTDGTVFDPNIHHGVAVENNPDIEDQHITETFQKGYSLKGKVLRPAMVKVNQK